jgi:hypothetical protein
MGTDGKTRLIQAAVGAVVITLLMQPVFLIGYGIYVWLLILPLLLFFALGADPKVLPAMMVSFAAGQTWAALMGLGITALGGFLPPAVAGLVVPTLVIFAMLFLHEGSLARTVAGNIPALFMGLALTLFAVNVIPAGGPRLSPLHVFGFFVYGCVLCLALLGASVAACRAALGRDWTPTPEPAGGTAHTRATG